MTWFSMVIVKVSLRNVNYTYSNFVKLFYFCGIFSYFVHVLLFLIFVPLGPNEYRMGKTRF